MKKLRRYWFCIFPLILTACHGQTDRLIHDSNIESVSPGSVNQLEDTPALPIDRDNDKLDQSQTKNKESKCLNSEYVLPDSDFRLYSQKELETLTLEYNLTLLIRLEQELKGKNQKDKEHSSNGNTPIHADYTDIVHENQYRKLYLTTENRRSGDAQPLAQVIEHDSYYEVTHGLILANTCYSFDVMEGKHVGDILNLGEGVYRITERETWCLENGETVYLEYIQGSDEAYFFGYYMLTGSYEDNYYILVGEDNDTEMETLYTGSLYFSKDCITTVLDTNNSFKECTITISEYLTKDKKSVGSMVGLYSSGELELWGDFTIDSFGQINSYTEYFIP